MSTYRWLEVTMAAPFAPRDGAGLLSFRGKLWLLGGWNPNDKVFFPRICNNEVWSSVDGRDWDLIKPNSFIDASFAADRDWEGRHTAGYAVHDGSMWLVGGDANQGHNQTDIWRSEDGRDWTRVAATTPWAERVLHHTVAWRERIWVLGGQTMPGFVPGAEDVAIHDDIWQSADGIAWTAVAAGPHWCPRGMIGGSCVLHDRLWLLGGGTYDTPLRPQREFYNDAWSTGDGVHWTQHTAAAPWAPRQYHEVAAWDDQLWVLEGYNAAGGNRNDVWYSADGEHWQELPATPWAPRHAASVVVHDDSLWVVAGNNMQSDVWRLVRA